MAPQEQNRQSSTLADETVYGHSLPVYTNETKLHLNGEWCKRMIEKIINSLLYGDSKTKSYMWSMLLLFVTGAGFGIAAIVTGTLPLWVFSVALFGLDGMIAQSISFKDMVKAGNERAHSEKRKKLKKKTEKMEKDSSTEGKKKSGEELINELGIKEFSKPELDAPEDEVENTPDKDSKKKALEPEETQKEQETKDQSNLKQYDEKTVKKIMVKYKVKKEHRKVIIDSSEAFHIHECPAYLWKDHKHVNFLLLEESPRIIKIPCEKIHSIGYKKLVPANPTNDYASFMEPCMVTKLFSEYLPQYKEGNYHGKLGVYKNLYTIVPDICITSASARNLLELLPVEFMPKDEVMRSESHSEYYKMAYKTSILWKDSVISTAEYKNRIKNLMTFLASEQISKEAYMDLLRQLVASKMITSDYASYYYELKK